MTSRLSQFVAIAVMVLQSVGYAGDWDCDETDRAIRPDTHVIDSIVSAARENPQEALASLEPLEQKYTRWRDRAALYDHLGRIYLKLERFEDARRVYQSGFDLEGLSTVVRENFRAALASVLSKLGRDDDIIALYERKDRPMCAFANASGQFVLAQAYAFKGRLAEGEAIVEAQLRKPHDGLDELIYGDEWLKLGLALACGLGKVEVCTERWDRLLRWPFRDSELSARLSEQLPRLRTWPQAKTVLERAASDVLLIDEKIPKLSTLVSTSLKPLNRIAPKYPRGAAQNRIEGYVELDVLVGANGKVQAVRIRDAVPAKIFDKVAVEAIKTWTFEPATRNGQPVPFVARQTVDFEIKK